MEGTTDENNDNSNNKMTSLSSLSAHAKNSKERIRNKNVVASANATFATTNDNGLDRIKNEMSKMEGNKNNNNERAIITQLRLLRALT